MTCNHPQANAIVRFPHARNVLDLPRGGEDENLRQDAAVNNHRFAKPDGRANAQYDSQYLQSTGLKARPPKEPTVREIHSRSEKSNKNNSLE
jgi:hypothetical protein